MKDFKLYAITYFSKDVSYEEQITQAILGGADIVQLRVKDISDRDFIVIAGKIRRITKKYKIPFIINNRVDIAMIIGADGVHLGHEDIPINQVRRLIKNRPFIIGVSTHSLKQALKAQKDGADYISVGPIFSTPTKPEYKSVGLGLVRKIKKKIKIPFVAIGGINKNNVTDVIKAGADRVAVVREICGASNIKKAAQTMKIKLQK